MQTVTVYGLRSSRDYEVRYVGQTVRAPKERLSGHLHTARRIARSAVQKWMRREVDQGHEVQMVILAECAELHATERDFIARFRGQGYRLLNLTDGGEGTPGLQVRMKRPWTAVRNRATKPWLGRKHTEESKEKVAAAKRGKPCPWNAEKNRRLADKMRHPHTEESKRKIGAAHKGKVVSAETGRKISEAKKGRVKLSPEAIAKLRAGHKAYFEARKRASV